MTTTTTIEQTPRTPSLIAVSDQTPPITSPSDAEVDLEVLKAVPKQFSICDSNTANWLVKKVVAAREYAERVKAWADAEVRRAEREEKTLMFLFGRQITAWTKDEIEKLNGKRKSLSLPGGSVGFRRINPLLIVDDEVAVIGWARRNCPPAIVTVEKLSKTVLKSHFEATGETPDAGVHVEPGCERFFIR
jgi:phage host-nuclease inhibitor protein Gam